MGRFSSKYHIDDNKSFRRRKLLLIVLTGLLIVSAGVFFVFSRRQAAPDSSLTNQIQLEQMANPEPKKQSVEGRYLFSGTVVLARAVEQAARTAQGYDYNQPFSKLSSFQPEQYDGWLADLECPMTSNQISYQEQVSNLTFNCRPEWLPAFTKYFSLVNLANNHTGDMGKDGFLETQRHLREAGIQTVGNIDPAVTKDTCEVMALPVRVHSAAGLTTKGELPIAFCAWHYFSRQPLAGEMEIIERYGKTMPVFSFMHVGAEYVPTAGKIQADIGRKLIDLGSEFVIGNSPHWVQNSEAYKGKPIIYSTGNFIFDQLDSETNRGLSMDVRFDISYDENLEEWLKLGAKCKIQYDTCLEQAEQQKLSKPKLQFTYEPIASSGGYKQVATKADAALQKDVEERLNWAQTKQQLQVRP